MNIYNTVIERISQLKDWNDQSHYLLPLRYLLVIMKLKQQQQKKNIKFAWTSRWWVKQDANNGAEGQASFSLMIKGCSYINKEEMESYSHSIFKDSSLSDNDYVDR